MKQLNTLTELYNQSIKTEDLLLKLRNKTNYNPLLYLYIFFSLYKVITGIQCELLKYSNLPFSEKEIRIFENICLNAKEQNKNLTEEHVGILNDIHLILFLLQKEETIDTTLINQISSQLQNLKKLIVQYLNETQSHN